MENKNNKKNHSNDDNNKNEIIEEAKNKNEILINNSENKGDKNEIIMNDQNENINNAENLEYFQTSYENFESHLDNCEQAILNDIKNIKKMNNPPNNRDLLWQLFLGVLPYQSSSNWNQIISDERTQYFEAKKKFITNDINEFILTKKIKDKYSSYFKFKDILSQEDYEFLDIIKVDVTRTFQKVELFKQEKIQQILINILYIFAKKNKGIGYRQGMSDLCAIFLYVIYKQKFLDPSFIEDKNTFLFYLLYSNNEFLEHDTYSLFSRFMLKGYMHFFLYNDEKYLNGDLSKIDNEKKKLLKKEEIKNSNDSELKKRIYLVYYHEFPLVDKQLYQFMVDKIEPEVFIVRWFICAFSREFTLPQLLELWDLILLEQFLVDKNSKKKDESNHYYKFVDYIVLSMLINIKNLIMLKKTNSELMSFLMKYPKNIEAKNIYTKALEIYNKNEKSIKI
jgi:TBC1 domain family protein 5